MKKKAVILLSGGLDSTLAAKMMLDAGVEVEAINFVTTFCTCTKKGCRHQATKVAEELGIKLTVQNITQEYLEVVKNPRFGRGSGMNPCIDCRIFTFRKAKAFMEDIGASFIVTGEVLGERPMSQRKDAIMIIERESGLKGLILRPLSAKLFEPTLPEKAGVVNREALLEISGRSRKPQMELAQKLGINDYPCPAGGCLLADPGFARRAKDLLAHNSFTLENARLLKFGRHFRLSESGKLVVGRNEEENNAVEGLAAAGDVIMRASEAPGPVGLLRGGVKEDLDTGLRIAARYVDKTETDKGKEGEIRENKGAVVMEYWKFGDERSSITVQPLDDEKIAAKRI